MGWRLEEPERLPAFRKKVKVNCSATKVQINK